MYLNQKLIYKRSNEKFNNNEASMSLSLSINYISTLQTTRWMPVPCLNIIIPEAIEKRNLHSIVESIIAIRLLHLWRPNITIGSVLLHKVHINQIIIRLLLKTKFSIFSSISGWFSVISGGNTTGNARVYRRVDSLVRAGVPAFLLAAPLRAYILTHSKMGK